MLRFVRKHVNNFHVPIYVAYSKRRHSPKLYKLRCRIDYETTSRQPAIIDSSWQSSVTLGGIPNKNLRLLALLMGKIRD